ncbi:LysR substrate-binding domain-containing protein [Marinobacterium zhoushanense]|uniref:LysR substrate-binding domain-containing protein n=1 Tax=Marinobacterium zhoushanense TaxID=1679163 RepID=UPI0016663D58|nr:LysR substrate-binding domain-containing protein [Marinobacterium zhoushanense]
MHFDFRDLELFISIAESESLTRGARRSNISLTAASTRLKGLEEQLGCRLFYRETRGVRLTPSGTRLLRHARSILLRVAAAKADFSGLENDHSGHLRILANTTAITEILPGVLTSFLAQRPGVTIDLQEASNRDIIRTVCEGSADLGIVSDLIKGTGLEVIPFATDNLVLVAAKQNPLSSCSTISFFDSLTEPHICLHEASSLFTFLQAITLETGEVFKPRVQVFGFESVCRLVESGVGVGVVPESCALRYIQTMELQIIKLSEAWARRRRCLILKDRDSMPQCGHALIEAILEHSADS